jgi:hemerythrin-like metal-binding protein
MDAEHRILIQKMNALHASFAAKSPKEKIESLLNDFVNYALQHFKDEEAFMQRVNFPGFELHQTIHKSLVAQVTKYVDEFHKTGHLTNGFFKFLEVWLSSHIKGIDIQYGEHAAQAQ